MPESLRLVVRTPHGVVFDAAVRSARLPSESGSVGLRPRGEPLAMRVEPGLVVVRAGGGSPRFVASAGGLLEADGSRATIYTPFAVAGAEADVLSELDRALATPSAELAARRRLGELEQRIVQEVRGGGRPLRARDGE